jgi:hypothetical protein
MPAQTTNLFLLEELEDGGRTSELAQSDLEALHAVADWIQTFVVKPHKDLGRAGTVCPFVPGSLERKTLWLAPEQIADWDVPEVVELMSGYKRLLLDAQPTDDDVIYNVIVVVSPTCRLIVPGASSTTSYSSLQFRRMWKMESCSGRTTKAMRGLRYTTRASDHSSRPCRFCSCGMESPATGSSSWTTRSGSTCGRIVMGSPVPTLLLRNCAACRGAWGATNPRVASLRKELPHAADRWS